MTLKPWDRRPWPKEGDESDLVTFEAVGRALTWWERVESQLCLLFEALLGFSAPSPTATRAFAAIRTSEARLEMLRAAGQTYFEGSSETELRSDFETLIARCGDFAPRRNDIAHGVVGAHRSPDGNSAEIAGRSALLPPYFSPRQRDMNGLPKFCYTSVEINYFVEEFRKLTVQAGTCAGKIRNLNRPKP